MSPGVVHRPRQVEMFASFLSETRPARSLLFFLFARHVVQKELGLTFNLPSDQLGDAHHSRVKD